MTECVTMIGESGRSLLHQCKSLLCHVSRGNQPVYFPVPLGGQDQIPQGLRINSDRWTPRCSIVQPAEWRLQRGSDCCSCSRQGISMNISASNVEHRPVPRRTTN